MQITQTELAPLNLMLHVKVEKSDYEADYLKKLKKQQAEGHYKGFRKGKAPMGFVKKMYGQQILAEAVNGQMQQALYKHIQDNKIDMLGDPLMGENHEQINFDTANLDDYTFNFEIGHAPEFELKGVTDKDEYLFQKVSIDDNMLSDEIAAAQKRFGDQEEVSDGIQEGDRIALSIYEVENGSPKEGGHESNFTVFSNDLSDEIKDHVMKLKQGDSFAFDINHLEKGRDEAFIRKYFLKLEDETTEVGNDFEGIIDTVFRLKEAEVGPALFDKMYGEGEVKTEAEAKEKIKAELEKHYDKQSTNLMYRHILESLVEKNNIDLPSEFLMKWLKWTNENTSAEEIEAGFDAFQDNLRWTLIKSKLGKKFDVQVTEQDIRDYVRAQVMGYLGAYATNEDFIKQMIDQVLQDKKQVQNAYSEIEAERIFAKVHESIKVKEKSISIEEFKELVKITQQNS